MNVDVVVIGGGPAGLAAAMKAHDAGARVALVERSHELGGILPQCIHQGFGLFVFKEMWTGPEYAQYFIDEVCKREGIVQFLETMVVDILPGFKVVATNSHEGVIEIEAKSVILAMGCRERTRSQILLPGDRPAGIYTAGTTQRLINVDGLMPGKRVVILGSGDVGLIMARRFMLEGAQVEGVFEILPYPGGLTRNVVQCLDDFDIPLRLSHTVVDIEGRRRVEAVTVAKVDEHWNIIEGTQERIECDTLVLAVGLIPENELSKLAGVQLDEVTGGPVVDEEMMTSVPGIFACGNVVHVHDVVDDVTFASYIAGDAAAKWDAEKLVGVQEVVPGEGVSYVVPQKIRQLQDEVTLYLRVKREMKNVVVSVVCDKRVIASKKERIARPPEMIKMVVEKEMLSGCSGDVLVEVRSSE